MVSEGARTEDVITIAGLRIGAGLRCAFIAEAGVNHGGDAELAHRLVDIAADAGADAVKFQTFEPSALASPDAPKAQYQLQHDGTGRSQIEMLRALSLERSVHISLKKHAEARGILFLSTPFDEASADFLIELGVPALKIGSGELTNHLLLAHVARKRVPLLLSTGMSTLEEVSAAVGVIRREGDPPLALLHCVSSYPAEPSDCNLRAMAAMRRELGISVGWSDHTRGLEVGLAAVALGASILEKHFTVSRSLPGPDHAASLEPDELAALVRGVRNVEAALGTGIKAPVEAERDVRNVARRSLRWCKGLRAGHTVSPADFVALRPADGLSPSEFTRVLDRRLARSVFDGDLVRLDDVEDKDPV